VHCIVPGSVGSYRIYVIAAAVKKRLFLHLQVFNFGKDRSDCLCIDRSAEESGEFPAVMDMCDLEAYDQPEAERRDRDE
jgi:hypothetical protein